MILREYFIHNDGSSPKLFIDNCESTVLESVYYFLDKNNNFQINEVWSNRLKKEIPLKKIKDPILAVKQGVINTLHFMVSQLILHEVEIPLLSVTITINFESIGNIIFGYRMGREWSDEKIRAFLCLVSSIEKLSPNIRVTTDGWNNEYKKIKPTLETITFNN